MHSYAGFPVPTRIPATSAQQRLWFLDRIDPGQASYNIGGGLRFRGVLDIDRLGQAIQALMQRHEAFRTCVVEAGGRPWLRVLQSTEAASDVIDLCGFQADQRDAEARRLGRNCCAVRSIWRVVRSRRSASFGWRRTTTR